MNTRLAFVLPGVSGRVSGGYRMVEGYAARLADMEDMEVHVVYVDGLVNRARGGRLARLGLARPLRPTAIPGVASHLVPVESSAQLLTGFDTVVTTSWQTAAAVAATGIDRAKVVGFVQGLETWSASPETLARTWRASGRSVAVSTWLASELRAAGCSDVAVVPNPVGDEFAHARRAADAVEREQDVAFLWHPDRAKGGDVALATAAELRSRLPDVGIWCFSAYPRPTDLPPGVRFVGRLDQPELAKALSDTAVFLSTSRNEGWSLTCTEAMAAGAALVSTDLPGLGDYAIDGETALLAPVDSVAALASRCQMLLTDPQRRRRIAEAGSRMVESFTWDASTDRLAQAVRSSPVAVGS